MTTRRSFLATTAAALSAPWIVPASILGRDGGVAPSSRVTLAGIGVGGRGSGNLRALGEDPRVEVVAVCDVDREHRDAALERASLPREAGCNDFREIVVRKDVDAVMVGTPDHWHALIAIAAARAGKDIYCEKPLASSIAEGRALSDAVREHGRILQCGTQRRSRRGCRHACELVRNGRIGKVREIFAGVPAAFAIRGGFTGLEPEAPVPAGFDYDLWLGPAPEAPFTPARCHFNFRWITDYAPGYITDWGAHYLDVAQWGNGSDESGPVRIAARNVRSRDRGIYDAPERFRIEYTYADGVRTVLEATEDSSRFGIKFVGDEGSVWVETDQVVTEPESLSDSEIGPNEVHLYDSTNHRANFIDRVLDRKPPAAPVEVAHRSATMCHLGAIAATLGRELSWDPDAERFQDDPEAGRLASRPLRGSWTL